MDHRLEILHAHSSVTTRALSFHLVSFRERKRVIYISGGIGKGEESSEERSEREREGERERGIACAGRRHSNHVSVFFSVAGAAHRDRGKKRTRTLNQS